ncbi:hypothetical protein MMIC_P0117 [Mariprofundus micogutta]|uniref:Beta-lactamase enzyme family protein n=1 Tax=Mariprofundus micogutta TaxID=1921010 RepID=A0A1L8CJU4_9PROT|nr:serine hydrolase [Mariprofundus micogutta]GAV19188.1 hypothetical protein MMIC_P0117 [Mariprofundus micogutta]
MIRVIFILAAVFLNPLPATAFPIDAADETGIERLEGYRQAQLGNVPGNRLFQGARLYSNQISLALPERSFSLPAENRQLASRIVALLGDEADDYSLSMLDISDPDHPNLVHHNADVLRNPASVGKIIVVLALFQALEDIYPDDIQARERILRDSMITADAFIRHDHHKVPFWLPERMRLQKRKLAEGDTANMWTYLDWTLSASSNAAVSMVIKHLLLLRHFGKAYPVTVAQEESYFAQSRTVLHEDILAALQEPVARNGLDPDHLRQGGFFSREGKRRVPGSNSVGTTRELMYYMLLMEQGKLVDAWSSLQLKKLLYLTQYRIRYASSPALKDAAVYFKSGSFYKCVAEPGFVCKKYSGNKLNIMNSVAIIEAPAGAPGLRYIVAITSNVLRKNSAVAHQTLATRLHALLQSLHPVHASQQ